MRHVRIECDISGCGRRADMDAGGAEVKFQSQEVAQALHWDLCVEHADFFLTDMGPGHRFPCQGGFL